MRDAARPSETHKTLWHTRHTKSIQKRSKSSACIAQNTTNTPFPPSKTTQKATFLVYFSSTYLPKGGSSATVTGYASRAVRRICKEGRKYGIGALVVSQRPSDLDETILSQCETFIALRLSNSQDQGIISAALPDNLGSISELLPSLRTGEAIIVGEAVKIPSRVRLPLIVPRPDSGDPEPSKEWKDVSVNDPEFAKAISFWRKQKVIKT